MLDPHVYFIIKRLKQMKWRPNHLKELTNQHKMKSLGLIRSYIQQCFEIVKFDVRWIIMKMIKIAYFFQSSSSYGWKFNVNISSSARELKRALRTTSSIFKCSITLLIIRNNTLTPADPIIYQDQKDHFEKIITLVRRKA